MQSRSKGLLKVFISSTFRDLTEERDLIFNTLNASLSPIGMENFIPDGKTPQEIALIDESHGLINSDLAIFLISPYYGSFIEKCALIEKCKADCPLKSDPTSKISYTHCEYIFAKAEKIPYQIYFYDEQGWNIVKELMQKDDINWKEVRSNSLFNNYSNEKIEHIFKLRKEILNFKKEIEREFTPTINSDQLSLIAQNLAVIIVKWYNEEKININNFCGRRKELDDLISKLDDSVEVHGIGGIGKTTLVHIALLLQKLKGKKIISIGKKQSYLSGSGYSYFKDKCIEDIYQITTNIITINDIIEALKISGALKIDNTEEKIEVISQKIEKENLLVFIDDFHLADEGVKKLVRNSKGFIIASKANTGLIKTQLQLAGIEEKERQNYINIIASQFGKTISSESREKIANISEGHPITIELLVRNFDRIDFKKFEDLKTDALFLSNPQHVDEFINRVIKDILSEEALELIKILSVINAEIETNIEKSSIIRTVPYRDKTDVFHELIDTGMIKKKEVSEGIYQFSYKHIQETIREEGIKFHHIAMNYYKNKMNSLGETADDEVEILHHSLKYEPNSDYTKSFLKIASYIVPMDYNYKRLIAIGEFIKNNTNLENQKIIYNTLGISYLRLHRYKEAKDSFNSYISIIEKLYSKNNLKYLYAKRPILINLGNLYFEINRYNEAETRYLEAYNISETLQNKNPNLKNKIESTHILGNLANVQKHLDKLEEAEENYNRYLVLVKDIAKKQKILYSEDVAKGLNNLAGLYVRLGRYLEAEQKSKESIDIILKLIKQNPNKYEPIYSKYIANLGRIHLDLEKFHDAEKELLDAYEKLQKYVIINQDAFCRDLVLTFDSLVKLYLEIKEITKAKNFAKESEKFKGYLVDQCSYAYLPSLGSTFRDLGIICNLLNKTSESLDYLTKSQSIIDKLSEKTPSYYLTDVSILHNIRGNVYLKLHNYEKAEEEWNNSLKISRELVKINETAYKPYLAVVLNNLGYLQLKLKRFDIAKEYLKECLEYRRKLVYQCADANLGDLTHTLNSLGNLYSELSSDESVQYFKEAQTICEMLILSKPEKYNENYAETLHNLGVFYLKNGDFNKARVKLKKSLKIRKELAANDLVFYLVDLIETLQQLGKLEITDNNLDDGERCLNSSLEHLDKLLSINQEIFLPNYALTLDLLGRLYSKKQKNDLAEEYLSKALVIRRLYYAKNNVVFRDDLLESLQILKSFYCENNKPELSQIIQEITKMEI